MASGPLTYFWEPKKSFQGPIKNPPKWHLTIDRLLKARLGSCRILPLTFRLAKHGHHDTEKEQITISNETSFIISSIRTINEKKGNKKSLLGLG